MTFYLPNQPFLPSLLDSLFSCILGTFVKRPIPITHTQHTQITPTEETQTSGTRQNRVITAADHFRRKKNLKTLQAFKIQNMQLENNIVFLLCSIQRFLFSPFLPLLNGDQFRRILKKLWPSALHPLTPHHRYGRMLCCSCTVLRASHVKMHTVQVRQGSTCCVVSRGVKSSRGARPSTTASDAPGSEASCFHCSV